MDISHLNKQQQDAILNSYDSDVLLLAGAGSGKTSVITHRVGYLIENKNVDSSEIMLLTFTNKAATEMKERISKLNIDVDRLWSGTFHSICVRILKKFGGDIGLNTFTVIDTLDSKKVMSEAMANLLLSPDTYMVKHYLNRVSKHKNNFVRPTELMQKISETKDLKQKQEAEVYKEYQSICWRKRFVDFDDLLIYTIILLQRSLSARQWFHDHIRYLLCDEAQDSNECQIMILQLLKGPNTNVFCVGDPDQSIYGFRNAKPESFMQFEKLFPGSKIMKLERNYRSTKRIILASNDVIKNNTYRLKKKVYSQNETGEKIALKVCKTNNDEGVYIANEMKYLHDYLGKSYAEMAALYRTNDQSRAIEDACLLVGVPYHVTGGVGFYNRKEIKDVMAFFRLRVNPVDEIAFGRAFQTQKGIGEKTILEVRNAARSNQLSYIDILNVISNPKRIVGAARKVYDILTFPDTNVFDYAQNIIASTQMIEKFTAEGTEDALGRIDNLKEFLNIAKEHEHLTFNEFVDQIALSTKENIQHDTESVSLMTIHSAKGLEFETVFVAGVEEGILPHLNSKGNVKATEEERRLMYVAMTRAKKDLYLTACETRAKFDKTISNPLSRFVTEISDEYLQKI